jgi:hypothetical protein
MAAVTSLAAGVLLTLSVLPAAASAPGQGAETASTRTCGVEFTPHRVTISRRTTRVLAEVDRPVGELVEVRTPEASGIVVAETRPDAPTPEPSSWVVTLDLSAAEPGTWELTLVGSSGECPGDLILTASGTPRR